jgi:hypothetical protein
MHRASRVRSQRMRMWWVWWHVVGCVGCKVKNVSMSTYIMWKDHLLIHNLRMQTPYEILRGIGTQDARIKHVRKILEHIGICKSVRGVSQQSYNTVYDIISNHPEADEKLLNAVDFYIRTNVQSRKCPRIVLPRATCQHKRPNQGLPS